MCEIVAGQSNDGDRCKYLRGKNTPGKKKPERPAMGQARKSHIRKTLSMKTDSLVKGEA